MGVFAESVFSLASKIGIPGWIVELRHNGTHNELPPLAIVRSAALALLDWLREQYWEQQVRHLGALTQECCSDGPPGDDAVGGSDGDGTTVRELFTPTMLSQFYVPALLDLMLDSGDEVDVSLSGASTTPVGSSGIQSSSAAIDSKWTRFVSVATSNPIALNHLIGRLGDHCLRSLRRFQKSLQDSPLDIEQIMSTRKKTVSQVQAARDCIRKMTSLLQDSPSLTRSPLPASFSSTSSVSASNSASNSASSVLSSLHWLQINADIRGAMVAAVDSSYLQYLAGAFGSLAESIRGDVASDTRSDGRFVEVATQLSDQIDALAEEVRSLHCAVDALSRPSVVSEFISTPILGLKRSRPSIENLEGCEGCSDTVGFNSKVACLSRFPHSWRAVHSYSPEVTSTGDSTNMAAKSTRPDSTTPEAWWGWSLGCANGALGADNPGLMQLLHED